MCFNNYAVKWDMSDVFIKYFINIVTKDGYIVKQGILNHFVHDRCT